MAEHPGWTATYELLRLYPNQRMRVVYRQVEAARRPEHLPGALSWARGRRSPSDQARGDHEGARSQPDAEAEQAAEAEAVDGVPVVFGVLGH